MGGVAADLDGAAPELSLHGSGADLCDGFYQNLNPKMARWFRLNFLEQPAVYGCTHVLDEDTEVWHVVAAAQRVYRVCIVFAMGRSWALFFCQYMMEAAVCSPPCSLPFIRARGAAGPSAGSARRGRLCGELQCLLNQPLRESSGMLPGLFPYCCPQLRVA